MELDDRSGLGRGHLESFKTGASSLFKIARLAFVDVSTAESMTEDATNADEWGPTPKAMSDICSVIYNSKDYLRIVQVLHNRFSLSTKKYWRQIHKSLILLEYLLCHGPEHLVMEFREDKDRLEELTRFVDVDSWTGIDRGSALQRRAKHVLHLLMDEAFYKEERTRAQKTPKVISGFGSQSFYHRAARQELLGTHAHSESDSELLELDAEGDSSTLLVDEDDQPSSKPDHTKKTFTYSDGDTSPVSQSESSWDAFATMSPGDSLSASGRSTYSTTSDANPHEDSPTSVLFRKSPHILDMDSLASEQKPTVVENPPKFLQPPAMSDYKCVMLRPPPSQLPVSSRAEERSSPLQKLPPPPPVAEYKCIMPRSPQSGSRVRQTQLGSVKLTRIVPDLILI